MRLHIDDAKQFGMRSRTVFPQNFGEASWLQWSPDGETLVSQHGEQDGATKLTCFWDWRRIAPRFTLESGATQSEYSSDVTWSPNCLRIAVSVTRPDDSEALSLVGATPLPSTGIEIRQVVGSPKVKFIPFEAQWGGLDCLQWLPQGPLIAAAADGKFRIINVRTSEHIYNLDEEILEVVSSIAISTLDSSAAVASTFGMIGFFDWRTWVCKNRILAPDNLFSIKWSPSGEILAAAGQNGSIFLYVPESDEPYQILEGHSLGADRMSFSADGELLCSVGRDNTIRLWDVKGGAEVAVFDRPSRWGPTDLIFHPNEMLVAAWNAFESQIEIWDFGQPAPAQILVPVQFSDLVVPEDAETLDDDFAAPEGQPLLRLHRQRERNKMLVEKRKQLALEADGCLRCQVCGLVFEDVYGSLGKDYIECHHTTPIAEMEPGEQTRLSDLALVCANCHRMLHRGAELLTIESLRQLMVDVTGRESS